jgi:hypothetical protein
MIDPFPGNPVTANRWSTVTAGHVLVYLGERVLDWVPASGDYRIWTVDRNATGSTDPLPNLVTEGNWTTIRSGHELIDLGHNRVLDWVPATGDFRVWQYDPSQAGTSDPFPGSPLTEGNWTTVRTGHRLISLDGDRVLDWVPATGGYRIWPHDPAAAGTSDPLPGPAVTEGTWATIQQGHELVYLGHDRVLDWEPRTGQFRTWRYDRTVTAGDPLPGLAEASGIWATIRDGHQLISLDQDLVLDWVAQTGDYRVWRYDRTITGGIPLHWESLDRDTRTLYVMEKLVATYGYPPGGAAGLVGNLIVESGLIPTRIEGSGEKTPLRMTNNQGQTVDFSAEQVMKLGTPTSPAKPGIGLAQWTIASRRNGLFAHAFGGEVLDFRAVFHMDGQIDFVAGELQTGFSGVRTVLMNPAVTETDASDEVVYTFERPQAVLQGNTPLPRSDPQVQKVFNDRRPFAQQALQVFRAAHP